MDFETGGVDKKNQHHSKLYPVTEFAAIAIRGDDLSEIFRYDNYIKPYDDQLEYTSGAEKITGITKELVEKEGVSLNDFMNDFMEICKEANYFSSRYFKPVIVGHNLQYDINFLIDLAQRTKKDLSKVLHGGWVSNKFQYSYEDEILESWVDIYQPSFIDTLIESKKVWGETSMPKFGLTDCCNQAGIDIIQAHKAMNDVEANVELFRYLIRKSRGGDVEMKEEENNNNRFRKTFKF